MTSLTTEPPATAAAERAAPTWAPLAVVLTGTFVTFLDFFIVNVALPAIGGDLHADSGMLSLVVAGYGLTFAAGMITGGRLGDLFGRRRMFELGLVLFTLLSLACGVAPTAGLLVVARLLQGAAGALLTPQVLALLGTVYAGPQRARAFAAYGFAMGIAAVVGQLVGGALIAADLAGLGWRAIFLINLPIGLAVLPLVRRVVPESCGDGGRARVDLAGTALGAAAVTALVLPLAEGRERGWPWWTWSVLALTPVLAAAFVVHQRHRSATSRSPLVEPALFRVRTFAVGTAAGLTFGLVPPAFFFVLALYLQAGRGYSALFSGAVFGVVGVGYFAAMLGASALHARMQHQLLALGALVVAAGCGLLIDEVHAASALALAPGLALVGVGIGFVLVPLSSTALGDVDPRHAGGAAGVLATGQQVGGALGVAMIGSAYFGVAGGAAQAFVVSLAVLAGSTVVTAVLAQLLRRRNSA